MKEGKPECAKPPRPPKPNLKNKDFVNWERTETCKPKNDNLVASDWHERLQRTPLFTPVYDNAPTNMVYLLSGEYGRMWEKEREDWYAKVFVLNPKERDMNERKKKIRKQAREAKKAAEVSIQERKARRAKELEAKAKAEMEKAEKMKAKLAKCAAKKKPVKKAEGKHEKAPSGGKTEPAESSDQKSDTCPKGWMPVELTVQCQCSYHDKEKAEKETEENQQRPESQGQPEEKQKQPEPESNSGGPTMCEDYLKQIAAIQEKKDEEAKAQTPS
ncbi:hypothetical protein RUM43_009159 [Polyplax serrata]|uniref:Uncharacterized protein n=1 Tax=Polyplax serrata TaxID=468196 RepID=A0AAN8NVJ8_POLSC